MSGSMTTDEDTIVDTKGTNGFADAMGARDDGLSDRGSAYHLPFQPRVLRIPAKQAVAHVNLLIAGGAGLGKTTFIKQFFNEFVAEGLVPHDGTQTPLEKFKREGGPGSLCTHLAEAVSTMNGEYLIHYHAQDTPGHGNIDNEELKDMVLNYVQNEKEAHFRIRLEKQNEGQAPVGDPTKEGRPDRLIDLCLYFIPPQNFSQLDVDFIVELSKEVMVIPVCAKADAMTIDERTAFQQLVRDRLTAEGITYTFIEEELKTAAKSIGLPQEGLQHRPPFVVVSSNTYRHVDGELRPVRQYPWGDCVSTDPRHSDFSLIKEFITTAAFHKLRTAKKRQFHRYCRQRMSGGHQWGEHKATMMESRAATKAREAEDRQKEEDVNRLGQELQRVKAELERERSEKLPGSAPTSLREPVVPSPEKTEIRSKSSLFGRRH